MNNFKSSIVSVISLLVFVSCTKQSPYTLAITNVNIWTGNPGRPWAEVMLMAGDTIAWIGNIDDQDFPAPTADSTIDANQRLIVPGFIDCHVHTIMGGQRLSSVKLKNVRTKNEFIQAIADYSKTLQPGEWILGGDWDHQNWGGELPTHDWIDSLTQKNPLWLERSEGHSGLANQLAMKAAVINSKTADVPGGIIERDPAGNPTGVFKDEAMPMIFRVIPDLSIAQKERALNDAMDYFLSEGVTTAHHMTEPHDRNPGGKATDFDAFKKLHNEGKLRVRFSVAEPITDVDLVAERIKKSGRGDQWLRSGILKGYVDGAIGSHSALFYDDYTDLPGFKGSQVSSKDFLLDHITRADEFGLQLCIHAIGDKAIHLALETFDSAIHKNGDRDRRFRIEHTQHIAPPDISYMRKLGVIASMQPYHAIDDGIWCEQAIGSTRVLTTYAHKDLLMQGVKLAFGSDWFVAPPSPLKGIYAAVTRRTLDNKNPNGWIPEQKITVEQALRAYTSGGAFAGFEEDIKGTLEAGKLADFIILEKNIFAIEPEKIAETHVDLTVVGGKVAYRRKLN